MILKCGTKVWVSGVQITETYGDLCIGSPNRELNQEIIDDAVKGMTRKVYLIQPIENDEVLPAYLVRAYLKSYKMKKNSDGSWLIIIFFTNKDVYNTSLEYIIENEIHKENLDWFSVAEEWWL